MLQVYYLTLSEGKYIENKLESVLIEQFNKLIQIVYLAYFITSSLYNALSFII